MVTLLNFFASDDNPLPPGWEVKTDQFGQVSVRINTQLVWS